MNLSLWPEAYAKIKGVIFDEKGKYRDNRYMVDATDFTRPLRIYIADEDEAVLFTEYCDSVGAEYFIVKD